LRPGGLAYLFVPTPDWAAEFTTVRALRAIGAESIGKRIQRSVDRVFKHHHLYDDDGWRHLAVEAGLEVLEVEPVLSTATTVAFEAFLLPSLPGLVNKHLTTRWTNLPYLREIAAPLVYTAVKALMDRSDSRPTAEYLVIARRPHAS
jgi:hypothetical protein